MRSVANVRHEPLEECNEKVMAPLNKDEGEEPKKPSERDCYQVANRVSLKQSTKHPAIERLPPIVTAASDASRMLVRLVCVAPSLFFLKKNKKTIRGREGGKKKIRRGRV